MLSITLPAFSLYHASGLSPPANSSDYQELESLVLREKAVVWADQEPHLLKSVGTEEVPQEAPGGGDGELAPLLSFSHLHYHTSSPCSKSSVQHLLLVMRSLHVGHHLALAPNICL